MNEKSRFSVLGVQFPKAKLAVLLLLGLFAVTLTATAKASDSIVRAPEDRGIILLDRSGSMDVIRPASGGLTNCEFARQVAVQDATDFFTTYPGGQLAVWTFYDGGYVDETGGYTNETGALAALNSPSLPDCEPSHLTPLASSICFALDSLIGQPDGQPHILYIYSDGGENNTDPANECWGPNSSLPPGPPPYATNPYDANPGGDPSWQFIVWNLAYDFFDDVVIKAYYWDAFALPRTADGKPIADAQNRSAATSELDRGFFQALAHASGGTYTYVALDADASATLSVEPDNVAVSDGDSFSLDVTVDGTGATLGAEIDLTFDPAVVNVTSLTNGGCLEFDLVDSFDNAEGTIEFDATSISGGCMTGTILTINMTAVALGATSVEIEDTTILANGDGEEIDVLESPSLVNVSNNGVLDGSGASALDLQGRANESGISIQAINAFGETFTTFSGSTGEYDLSLAPGTYNITVNRDLYLGAERLGVVVPANGSVSIPSVTLLAGDINGDEKINIFDIAVIAGQYGQDVPPADPRADVNGDGTVNIFDVALAAGNYNEVAPVPWP